MTTAETTRTPAEIYAAARAEGKNTLDAVYAVLAAYPQMSGEDVAALSWQRETGKAAPRFTDEGGRETAAGRAWGRGFERRTTGSVTRRY